jgi:hypothetical protein
VPDMDEKTAAWAWPAKRTTAQNAVIKGNIRNRLPYAKSAPANVVFIWPTSQCMMGAPSDVQVWD